MYTLSEYVWYGMTVHPPPFLAKKLVTKWQLTFIFADDVPELDLSESDDDAGDANDDEAGDDADYWDNDPDYIT